MRRPAFTLDDLLAASASARPDQEAIVDGDRRVTYADLDLQVGRLARHLVADGLQRGDRVAIWLERRLEAVVALLAVVRAGGVFVNVSPVLKSPQVRHILSDSGATRLIGERSLLETAELCPVRIVYLAGHEPLSLPFSGRTEALSPILASGDAGGADPSPATEADLATILYTSGSTGLPKGIMFSQRNLVAGAEIVSTYLENDGADRVMALLPLSFDYGLSQLTTMLRVGGTLVLQRSLMPGEILSTLRRERVTGLALVPPLWPVILQCRRSLEGEAPAHLRYVTNSGGAVARCHLAEMRTLLSRTRIYLMYGLTEAFRSTYLPPDEIHRGPSCIGRPIPGTEIFVVNDRGEETGPGEVGELVHRGPTVAMGYWRDAERTAKAYRPNPFAPPEVAATDRVVFSGDLVRRDAEGFLYFAGRRDAQIKTHGYRVSPEEAEALLLAVPGVREAAVFPEADREIGQRIVAVVSLWDGVALSPEMVRAGVRREAPHYLVPGRVHIVDALPKTATGKLDRGVLKDVYGRPDTEPGREDRHAVHAPPG
jgi:acyl-CoA ligase (AMP-forming) (exosortase A-associated)